MSADVAHTFARLLIDGLAICYFNRISFEEKPFWEVAFLRYKDHELKIKVDVVEQGSPDENEVYEREYKISREVNTIDFIVDDGSSTQYETFKDGYVRSPEKFSRACGDRYDFRRVVNFVGEDLPHGEFFGMRTGRDSRVKVTLVRIPHSLFYTHRPTEDYVILAHKRRTDLRNGFIYGPTNELIGAMIYASKPGGGKIVVGNGAGGDKCEVTSEENKNCVIDLPPLDKGFRYKIKMDNMDIKKRLREDVAAESLSELTTPLPSIPDRLKIKNYVKGDFYRYYDVINMTGEKLHLWAPKRQLKEHNKVGDCHAVRLETGEIHSLAELIEESPKEIKQEGTQSEQS